MTAQQPAAPAAPTQPAAPTAWTLSISFEPFTKPTPPATAKRPNQIVTWVSNAGLTPVNTY